VQEQSLHDPIPHGGNADKSIPTTLFLAVEAFGWIGLIVLLLQLAL
jgi:hypothetical protein